MADTTTEWADPALLDQVREAMQNCEENGYWDETVALGPVGLCDELIEKDAFFEDVDPDALLVATKTFLAQHGLLENSNT